MKTKTEQEQLETFWKELYGCAVAWAEKYHINNKNYELYTTCESGAFWHIDEFVFEGT